MTQIHTTVVGSMPKPAYLNVPGWFTDGKELKDVVRQYNQAEKAKTEEDEHKFLHATKEIVDLQRRAGVDVITDGELRRDSYVYGFCRRLNGVDFDTPRDKICRNGAWEATVPRIISEIAIKEKDVNSLVDEWKYAQSLSKTRVKITIPGPMTIMDTTFNEFYENEEKLGKVLVQCINNELKKLDAAGCKEIQIDEPVMVRYPDKALKFGIKFVSDCFDGLSSDVFKSVHACCGYPTYLDQTDYVKADIDAYEKLANAIDDAGFDAFSIEDTHRRNDLQLFSKFKKTKVILGAIDVVRSRVETVDEIREHITEVLQYIPPERLMVAPDCGLIFLPMDLAEQKLTNMVKAVRSINSRLAESNHVLSN